MDNRIIAQTAEFNFIAVPMSSINMIVIDNWSHYDEEEQRCIEDQMQAICNGYTGYIELGGK